MLPQSLEHDFRMAASQRIMLHCTQIFASFKTCTIHFCVTIRMGIFTTCFTVIHFPYIVSTSLLSEKATLTRYWWHCHFFLYTRGTVPLFSHLSNALFQTPAYTCINWDKTVYTYYKFYSSAPRTVNIIPAPAAPPSPAQGRSPLGILWALFAQRICTALC